MQLIIPAYNEERRLPGTLRMLRAYVLAASEGAGAVDVIVVDNASTDATAEVARSFDSAAMPVRVLHCARRGKGAAVRAGVAATTGDRVAFMDADGATHLDALVAAGRLIDEGVDLAVGSRALDASITIERHSKLRVVGAAAYRYLTRKVAPGITDTQCGFKMMRGDLAREIFAEMQCDGFSFDVELIGRFQRCGARVEELAVIWVDVPGSTFVPARHGLASFAELAAIGWRLGNLEPARREVRWLAPPPVVVDEAAAEV
jgi:glycosyltransferase involved in cell wall biosynthesis